MLTAAAWLAVGGATAPVAAMSDAAAIDMAVATCERWLLDPASWADDMPAFGRGTGLQTEASVPDAALPPPSMRVGMHHWRVPIRDGGVLVTTSDRLPFCHLAGGGPFDLQPSVDTLLRSTAWAGRWKPTGAATRRGAMASRQFVSSRDPKLTMTLSYAAAAGGRTDRVQLIATAQYQPGN